MAQSPFAHFSATACWKLTSHLEEFINGEAMKGDRGDGVAMDWAATSLKQLWERIGEIDNDVRRNTANPPEHVSGPIGRVLDGIEVGANRAPDAAE
jgi:hypothetical protein